MRPFKTGAQILALDDLKLEAVDVPEWDCTINVRSMTGADRDAFEASLMVEAGGERKANLTNMRAKLVACTAVDESGQPLFTAADLGALTGKSASAIERLFHVAQRLNGMTAAAVDEAEKNSGAAQAGASPSASP